MVRSEPGATGTGTMAALDVAAKPIVNAAPRTIVRIIDCFLIDRLARFEIGTWKLSSDMTKTMTDRPVRPFIMLNGPLVVRL